MSRVVPPATALLAGAAVWQMLVRLFKIDVFVFPAPTDVARAAIHGKSALLTEAAFTLSEAALGFAVGCLVGFLLGVLFAYARVLERSVFPFVVASNSVPVVAVAPIIILLFGQSLRAKVAVTAFLTFFPVCVNTMRGLRSTPAELVELLFVHAANRWQEFWKVRLPAAAPAIFSGLRVAASLAVIGAIVAEFVSVQRGLGAVIVQSNYFLRTPMLFAATIAAMILGIAFYLAIALLEKIVIKWERETL